MRRFRTSSYVSRGSRASTAQSRGLRSAALCSSIGLCAVGFCVGLAGCTIDGRPRLAGPIERNPLEDAGLDGGDAGDDGSIGDAGEPSLLDALSVDRTALIRLDEPVITVQQAGEHTLLLHRESGVSLLNLSDPTAAHVTGAIPTTGRAVATRYDAERQVVWILALSGELSAYRLTDPTRPVQIGSLQVPSGDQGEVGFFDLARVGRRLFALQRASIVPVTFSFDDAGQVAMQALAAISIDEDAERIAEGGPGLYVAFAGGVVRSYTATTAPIHVDEVSVRGDIVGWAVRGQRLVVALRGVGVRVLELEEGRAVRVLLRLSELDDPLHLARIGQLAVVALERGVVLALDLSLIFDGGAPSAIASYAFESTDPPAWIASARGDLLLGNGSSLSIVSLPPLVERGVLPSRALALPRYARIGLQLSKPLDPEAVTIERVVLQCEGDAVPTTPALSTDRTQLTLLPTATLPARASCELAFHDVRDERGLALSSSPTWLTFKTELADPSPIASAASQLGHSADGALMGYSAGRENGFEYADITPARGLRSDLYVDYDGARMWLLFDVIGSTDRMQPSCYGSISGFSAEGEDVLQARVFNDQHVEVSGIAQSRVLGGTSYGVSPSLNEPHNLFEIAIETAPGRFRFQLHAPDDAADCATRLGDPISFGGTCGSGGCTIDPTVAITTPRVPTRLAPAGEIASLTPTLSWVSPDRLDTALSYEVELREAGGAGRSVYRATAYVPALPVPSGVLLDGEYTFSVHAVSPAGSSAAAEGAFSVALFDPAP